MNMDHMFIMRLAALLFGGGIASCLFPGKSRMSHVLFLLLVLAETAVAHATIPDGWWFLLPGVVSVLLRLSFKGGTESGKGGKALLSLHATDGTIIRYYYWFSNFLVYGGAGSGKTKSIGKPLMEQYIRSGFAGFIYDFKDFDYTRTAYNLIRKHGYPHEFYYVNFTDMNRTYRFNPLDRRNIKDRTMLMQLMEDVLGALMPPTSKQDEWYTGALGILNGVAYRLWDEFPECCTLPHIVNFVMKADTGQLQEFLKLNDISAMMAGAYLIPLRIFFLEIRLVYVEYIEMFHEGSHLIFLLLKFREAFVIIEADFFPRRLMLHGDIVKSHGKGVRSFCDHQVLILQLTEGHEYREGVSHPVHLHVEHKTVHAVVRTP